MIFIQKMFASQRFNIRLSRNLKVITCNCEKNGVYVRYHSFNSLKESVFLNNRIIPHTYLYHSTPSLLANVELQVDFNVFDKACEETLESLTEFFEELIESDDKFAKADVSYSGGVLTINLGKYGTYVINRQAPNKQIWLSSPLSGPKRYDYVTNGSYWIYKHDSVSLHELLESEVAQILGKKADFSKCLHVKQ